VQSATTIKLAKSRKSLKNEKYVTMNGTPGTFDVLVYLPNNDNGDSYINTNSGAILAVVHDEAIERLWSSEVIWGSRAQNIDGSAVYGLNLFSPSYSIGVFETQRVYSSNISQTWNDFVSFIDNHILDNEEFILNYRVDNKEETKVMTGVWLNANTINSVSLNIDPWEDIEDGNEVIIVDGYGRGYSAHILESSLNSNTKSIVLDEEVGTVNESVTFFVTNYKKEMSHPGAEDSMVEGSPEISGGWVQIKCEMRGFEIAVAINDLGNTKDE
jgi:hypothetical protein